MKRNTGMFRATAHAAVGIWAAKARRAQGAPSGERFWAACPVCGRVLGPESVLYSRRGTGQWLGCGRCVDVHTAFAPACGVCGAAPDGGVLYTVHGCDEVLGCGACVSEHAAGALWCEGLLPL